MEISETSAVSFRFCTARLPKAGIISTTRLRQGDVQSV